MTNDLFAFVFNSLFFIDDHKIGLFSKVGSWCMVRTTGRPRSASFRRLLSAAVEFGVRDYKHIEQIGACRIIPAMGCSLFEIFH